MPLRFSGRSLAFKSVCTAIMPQPISTPTAAGIIAPLVGITLPTVAPMPQCTSGIAATHLKMNGSCATFSSCLRASSSRGTPFVHALIGAPFSGLMTLYFGSRISLSSLRVSFYLSHFGPRVRSGVPSCILKAPHRTSGYFFRIYFQGSSVFSMQVGDSQLNSSAALDWAHPWVRYWFLGRLGAPTEPQEQGWPSILRRQTTLISAPTGSGKALAAFLICIDRLVRKALSGELVDRTEVLYVSPLKALGNDIQKNLETPLGEILQLAGEGGLFMPDIRTAVRTGDTLMHERRAMLVRPPHILVTTPESLYILLTAERSRAILRDVETIIVDEIHAIADDKRGAHLTLSLERLEALTTKRPVRIGLSATQKPIQLVARFLTGNDSRPEPAIVDIGHQRQMDIAIEVPSSEL